MRQSQGGRSIARIEGRETQGAQLSTVECASSRVLVGIPHLVSAAPARESASAAAASDSQASSGGASEREGGEALKEGEGSRERGAEGEGERKMLNCV